MPQVTTDFAILMVAVLAPVVFEIRFGARRR
jgi:hypothetical protein